MVEFPGPVCVPATDEDRRLEALYALNLLDSEPESAFDALVALAAQWLDCPTSLLTLIDRDRQWVKAACGADVRETARDIAFCDHTIRGTAPLVTNQMTTDTRFCDNPFVDGSVAAVRFYAGVPIQAMGSDGHRHAIGALCVLDIKPRIVTEEQTAALRHLATIAEALIAARGAAQEAVSIAESMQEQARTLRRQERIFRQVERTAMIGSWRFALADEAITWSDGVYRIHELDPDGEPDLARALEFYPPRERAVVSAALARTIETGMPYELDLDFITAKGKRRRVHSQGELEIEDGRPIAVIGVFQDITDRYRVERSLRESASIDAVTRIANRAEFNRVLEDELQAAHQTGSDGAPLILVLIDLDDFKSTNDTHGHLAGDDVLRAVGQRLRAPFLRGSFAARLGGDEFAVLLTDPALVADADGTIGRLLDHLKAPVQSSDALLTLSGTIGSARPGPGIDTVRELVHAADTALYAAKRTRRGTAQTYQAGRAARV